MRHLGSDGALKRGAVCRLPHNDCNQSSPAAPVLVVLAIEIGSALLADIVAILLGILLGFGAMLIQILLEVVFRGLSHRILRRR
jgi:hypothetical protein